MLAYIAALCVAFVSTHEMASVQSDEISGAYLVFIGMPWTLALAYLEVDRVPEILLRAFVVFAPMLNVGIAMLLCRSRRKRY
jgi:hypothetical protein